MKQDYPVLRIAVIGATGKEGRGLAARWALAGQQVIIGSRQAEKAQATAGQMAAEFASVQVTGLSNADAAAAADVVVMSVPYSGQAEILNDIKGACQGKVFVNVGVPLDPADPTRVQVPPAGSASGAAQAALGPDVRVVAAFQNVSAPKLRDPRAAVDCDVLICGDDPEAKRLASHLVELTGMRPIDAGALVNAVGVETLTAILVGVNKRHKVKGAGIRVTGLSKPLPQITLTALPGIPLVKAGDDLPAILLDAAAAAGVEFRDGDVLLVAQKVVSKAEGCAVRLAEIEPSGRARTLAAETGKDQRLVEVVLRESAAILRSRPGLLISEQRLGWVCANAGVDRSNVAEPSEEVVLMLPGDPDRSAAEIRGRVNEATGADIAVIVTDTHGRPFRLGATGVALGVAGLLPLADLRGRTDLFGYELRTTTIATADELAAAAGLLMGQANEGLPAVLVRGAAYARGEGSARDLQMPRELDLFR
jgi:coenzyme F420-0:L-glutamate ligase/coenzyme F420-1:gamma-L-glutamate ligase